jgi:hypothetical protein
VDAQEAQSEGVAVEGDRLLEILNLACLLKPNVHGISEIVEGRRAIGMPRRKHGEGVAMVGDCYLKIPELTSLLKTSS